MKKIAAALTATAAITAGLVAIAGGASAEDCYEAGVDDTPWVYVQLTPPQVTVDDGDPYVRTSPSCVTQ